MNFGGHYLLRNIVGMVCSQLQTEWQNKTWAYSISSAALQFLTEGLFFFSFFFLGLFQ